ncbi:MAG: helix-turn-helix transcriptional regulator, partial [Bacillota bacterium]|nr:helix-turn-helix transcriptional regulator [Bacillota bacterium]
LEKLLVKVGYQAGGKKTSQPEAANEIRYLDEQFSHYVTVSNLNESLLLNYAIESLLKGRLDDEQANLIRNHESLITAPYYLICLASVSHAPYYRDLSRSRKYQMIHELAGILSDTMRPLCLDTKSLLVASDSAVCILQLKTVTVTQGLILAFAEAKKRFKQHHPLEFALAVSSVCADFYALQDAFEEAESLLQERFFVGEDAILLKKERQTQFSQYNRKLENEIWLAIQEDDGTHMEASVNAFFSELDQLSYDYARLYVSQLTTNLLTYSLDKRIQQEPGHFDRYRRMFDNLETLEQCRQKMLAICRQLSDNHRTTQQASWSESVERAMNMIRERYMEPDFSTKLAAQEVSLSIVYFNRLFKKETGVSFSTCLNKYRLDMACILLATTDLSMSQICERVSFVNESYFYTLFKKEYGITPQKYRIKQAKQTDPHEKDHHLNESSKESDTQP